MSVIQFLKEAISREEAEDLVKTVAIMSTDGETKGRYLNLNRAKRGEVEWVGVGGAGIFLMKNKMIKDIIPIIADKIGNYKIVYKDDMPRDYGKSSFRDEPVRTFTHKATTID
ncbi:MAG: hypothetical protein PHF86_10115 [Candidatus Nanoarchaeia archaeon]|nr:hypothetical protein [Candidatus Nanoarchaeia archaeon]